MNDNQKLSITKAIVTLSSLSDIDKDKVNDYLESLLKMNIDDAIDKVLTTLNYSVMMDVIKKDDILANVHLLLNIYPEKYRDTNSLLDRLNYLRRMNLEHPSTSIELNHKLVLEAFCKFNNVIGHNLDAYYTGGLVGYISTKQDLVRYHSDLDMIINEEELFTLKKLVDESDDFNFVNNMDNKNFRGHEFKITYKDTPMSIGIFLFEREKDGGINNKEYFYDHDELFVCTHSLSPRLVKLCLDDSIHIYNNTEYKMVSLEYIYNQKKYGRPKDRFDAEKIEIFVNKDKDNLIDSIKKYDIKICTRQPANNSIVNKFDKKK